MTGSVSDWRVRALGPAGVSAWSSSRTFNMRGGRPKGPSDNAGFMQWTPVPGATGYQVWIPDTDKLFTTITTVADQREFFLSSALPESAIEWRVRAERRMYGAARNGLPAVSYGPWSVGSTKTRNPRAFVSNNGENPLDRLVPFRAVTAVSDKVESRVGSSGDHKDVPAVTSIGDPRTLFKLYRTYLFTDSNCVNRVFTGYPLTSPAYAPRTSGATTTLEFLRELGIPWEGAPPPENISRGRGRRSLRRRYRKNLVTAIRSLPKAADDKRAKVDLWDSNWPRGHYFTAVVPVNVAWDAKNSVLVFRDTEVPQDQCEVPRRVLRFGKVSRPPVLTVGGAPTAVGLAPNGRRMTAVRTMPKFYGSPLVTWEPVGGATRYHVQWGRSGSEQPAGSLKTPATSAMLPLTPGTWWYRVRGINDPLPDNQLMSWSESGASRSRSRRSASSERRDASCAGSRQARRVSGSSSC